MNILKSSPVGIPERAFAALIDIIITFGSVFMIDIFIIDESIIVMAVVFSLFYSIILPVLWDGYTVGKRLIGIRISHVKGDKLTISTMLVRELIGTFLYNISVGVLTVISIYLVYKRDDKRSIHDLLASTYVTSNMPEQE